MDAAAHDKLFDAALSALQDPLKRASLAAPFAAAGLDIQAALSKADSLIYQAIEDLHNSREDEIYSRPSAFVTLDMVCDRLHVKEPTAIKKICAAMAKSRPLLERRGIDGQDSIARARKREKSIPIFVLDVALEDQKRQRSDAQRARRAGRAKIKGRG